MRVTNEMMISNSLRRLSTRLERYEKIQSRLATGKQMLAPSDDPAGANRALSLRAAQRSREQEARNAADARSWLDVADGQLQAVVERLHRARDLTTGGASLTSDGERGAIAQELDEIQKELVAIANSRHRGRPLFAGFAPGAAVERDAGGAWAYVGDGRHLVRRVGDEDEVDVSVTAEEVFWFGGGENVFQLIDDIVADLAANDPVALSGRLGQLDDALASVGDSQAAIGAAANHVDSAERRSSDVLLAIRSELAQVEDVEITEAVMDLQVQEVAYQATLAALAKALPPSLASFLR